MIPRLPAPGWPAWGWVAQPRDCEGLRALPAGTTHVWQCPACRSKGCSCGQSGRDHPQLCRISPLLLPTNILKVTSSFPSSSITQTQAQQILQAGMDGPWAEQ